MKKAACLFLVMLLANFLIPISPVKAVDEVSVAECKTLGYHWQSSNGKTLSQTFRSDYDTISSIHVWLGGEGKFFVNIIALDQNNAVLMSTEIDYDGPGRYSIGDDDFAPFKVVPGGRYALSMSSPQTVVDHPSWETSNNPDCYSYSSAEVDGAVPADQAVKDYNFVINGYNTPTEAAAAPPVNNSTPVDSSKATAPATNTSTSLEAPTSLTASSTTIDSGSIVSLKWKASKTTDIDGYKIYRSLKEDSEFTLIATTSKTILDATDSNVVSGTNYYYFIRAYKGSNESSSTNTAKVTPTDNKSSSVQNTSQVNNNQTPANKSFFQRKVDFIKQNLLDLLPGIAGLLILIGIVIYTVINKNRKKSPGPKTK